MDLGNRPLFDNPADARLFVDRDEARRLEENCRAGINTLVLGERGMGKTTLLRQVLLRLRTSGFPAVGVNGEPADNALDLVRLVAGELRRHLPSDAHPLPYDPPPTPGFGEVGKLIAAVRALHPVEDGEGRGKAAILVDSPPGAELAHLLFGRLRDELWQLPYTWVLSASSDLRGSLLTPPADTFFEDVIELQPLSRAQQEELVGRRFGADEMTSWRLPSAGEDNPRRLLEIVRNTFRSGRDPDSYLVALVRREAEVNALGRAASMLYSELVNSGSASASDDALLGRLGWSRQRAAQVLNDLEREGLVTAEMRPGPSGRPRKVFAPAPIEVP